MQPQPVAAPLLADRNEMPSWARATPDKNRSSMSDTDPVNHLAVGRLRQRQAFPALWVSVLVKRRVDDHGVPEPFELGDELSGVGFVVAAFMQLDVCCRGRHASTMTASSSAKANSTSSSRRSIELASWAWWASNVPVVLGPSILW
jgi:hypothetical protein